MEHSLPKHEWRNDSPTVPAWDPVNSLLGEYAENSEWETKTPWSFTISCCGSITLVA